MRKANVTKGSFAGEQVTIEGTDREVFGKSVWDMNGHPASMKYGIRSANDGLPIGGTHYYGKHSSGLGDVFHESELQFEE